MDEPQSSQLLLPQRDGLPLRPSGAWAEDKLDILQRYIEISTVAMKDKPWRRRYYIDLFAGPGKNCIRPPGRRRCRSEDPVILGSPLLALTRGAGYTHYVFVERDEENAHALRQRVEAATCPTDSVWTEDCNEVVRAVAAEVQQVDSRHITGVWPSLVLAFIDPEGLTFSWQSVRTLASAMRADLIIHFSTQGLNRGQRQAQDAAAGDSTLDAFFGTSEWRGLPRGRSGLVSPREMMTLYVRQLESIGYNVGDFREMRNSKNSELYRLIFATKDPTGLALRFWDDARNRGPKQRSLF